MLMKASDIMVTEVITAKPSSNVHDVAKLLLVNRISAVPVVNDTGELVGIVSEGDLIRRSESGTGQERSWWLKILMGRELLAAEHLKEHSPRVADVMTREFVSAGPDTKLQRVLQLMVTHRVRSMPVVDSAGHMVGIIAREDVMRALDRCAAS